MPSKLLQPKRRALMNPFLATRPVDLKFTLTFTWPNTGTTAKVLLWEWFIKWYCVPESIQFKTEILKMGYFRSCTGYMRSRKHWIIVKVTHSVNVLTGRLTAYHDTAFYWRRNTEYFQELLNVHNGTPHETTGDSPHYLWLGVQSHLPVDALLGEKQV